MYIIVTDFQSNYILVRECGCSSFFFLHNKPPKTMAVIFLINLGVDWTQLGSSSRSLKMLQSDCSWG